MLHAQPPRRGVYVLAALSLLLVPLIGGLLTEEVNWGPEDYVVMGPLLVALALGVEYVLRRFEGRLARVAAVAVILGLGFLIWAELAVGIFGSPFAGS